MSKKVEETNWTNDLEEKGWTAICHEARTRLLRVVRKDQAGRDITASDEEKAEGEKMRKSVVVYEKILQDATTTLAQFESFLAEANPR